MSRPSRNVTKTFGAFETKHLKIGSGEWCLVNHNTQNGTKKFATYAVYFLGHPSGFLCNACMKEWNTLWKETSPIEYI